MREYSFPIACCAHARIRALCVARLDLISGGAELQHACETKLGSSVYPSSSIQLAEVGNLYTDEIKNFPKAGAANFSLRSVGLSALPWSN